MLASICLADIQPAHHIGDALREWFECGAVLASNGVDVYDLDKVVHDRKVVPDSRAACAVLTGYYAQKRVQRLF